MATEKENNDPKVEETETAVEVVKYPTIRRMLNTLDKFLAKKLVLVLGLLSIGIVLCSGGVLLSAASVSAATGPGVGSPVALETFLFSLMALFAFAGVVTIIYFVSRRKHIKKHAE